MDSQSVSFLLFLRYDLTEAFKGQNITFLKNFLMNFFDDFFDDYFDEFFHNFSFVERFLEDFYEFFHEFFDNFFDGDGTDILIFGLQAHSLVSLASCIKSFLRKSSAFDDFNMHDFDNNFTSFGDNGKDAEKEILDSKLY